MKRLLAVVALSLLTITLIAGFLLINNRKLRTVKREKVVKKEKLIASGPKILGMGKDFKMPALPESRRAEAIAKFKIIYPATILGSGPPKIFAPSLNLGFNPDGKTTPYDIITLEYPSGIVIRREYRDPNDVTIHNWKEFVAQSKKEPYSDGNSWQLTDINGHEARAIEKGFNIYSKDDKEPTPASVVFYKEPFLYYFAGSLDMPLSKVLPLARRFTTLISGSPPPGSQNIDIGVESTTTTATLKNDIGAEKGKGL